MKLSRGQREYAGRVAIGKQCMSIAWDGTAWDEIHPEDRESAAKDAISDMLTTLFGLPGAWSANDGIEYNEEACEKAEALLASALNSYHGDAEDYTR